MSDIAEKHPHPDTAPSHGAEDSTSATLMFGFWVFLMSDAILFGMLFATYVTSVDATAGGPGPRDLYELGGAFVETLVLLASSLAFGMASLALRYHHGKPRLVGWLVLTLLLGLVFAGLEMRDFASMFSQGGVPGRSGFLSAFFGLVPLHGLHVAAGCVWMLALLGQIARYGVDSKTRLGIMRLALFWHFLDIVWIAIFSVVYLMGLA